MNMNSDNEEIELLDLLNSFSRLEWRKFRKKHAQVWHGKNLEMVDCSTSPPFISFRFMVENKEFIEQLRLAVSKYEGEVSWVLTEHKRIGLPGSNFMICPRRYWELKEKWDVGGGSVSERMAKENPDLGLLARSDIGRLKDHLKSSLTFDDGEPFQAGSGTKGTRISPANYSDSVEKKKD